VRGLRGKRTRSGEKIRSAALAICRKRGGAITRAIKRKAGRDGQGEGVRRRAIRTDLQIRHLSHLKRKSMTELAKIEKPAPYRKYTPEQMIEALTESRGLIAPAARALGCSRDTIRSYLQEYTAVSQAKDDAKEATKDLAENRLVDAIEDREAWAICFYLKTQAKDRGYIERGEVSGLGGSPVKIKLVYDE
jgi:DNA-binding transcriptional MerR regulator